MVNGIYIISLWDINLTLTGKITDLWFSEGHHQTRKGARFPMVLAILEMDVKINSYDNFLWAQAKSNRL